MPLPFIPVVMALTAAAGFGGKKIKDGFFAMRGAKSLTDEASERHKRHIDVLESARAHLQLRLEALQMQRQRVLQSVSVRMADLLQVIGRRAKISELLSVGSAAGTQESVLRFESPLVEHGSLAKGAITAVGAGGGAAAGAASLVGVIGAAGTGTSIAGLSGAAATNATLAWLGGGTLASGGMGMAGGMAILGGLAAAPLLLVGGLVLDSQAAKAKVNAEEFAKAVDEAVAKIDVMVQLLHRAELRVAELEGLTEAMASRAVGSIDHLDQVAAEFDDENADHIARLRGAMLFCSALRKLIDCRVLDDEGKLDASSEQLILELRGLLLVAPVGGQQS